MSKELTEQYYKGTLLSGHYYFSNGCEVYPVEHRQIEPCLCANGITVLDKVPNYEEYQALLSQLSAISEQLKEANEVIKYATSSEPYENAYDGDDVIDAIHWKCGCYLKKYGVEK